MEFEANPDFFGGKARLNTLRWLPGEIDPDE